MPQKVKTCLISQTGLPITVAAQGRRDISSSNYLAYSRQKGEKTSQLRRRGPAVSKSLQVHSAVPPASHPRRTRPRQGCFHDNGEMLLVFWAWRQQEVLSLKTTNDKLKL